MAGCLTGRESFTRRLSAPFASTNKALRVLPSLLDVQLPFPLEECVYDFLDVRKAGKKEVTCVAVAARQADIRNKIIAYNKLGLDPQTLDQEGAALWTQSIEEMPDDSFGAERNESRARAVVYLGGDRTTVAAGKGSVFAGVHSMQECRADRINRALRTLLGADTAPVVWAWAGPKAADTRLVEDLLRHLDSDRRGASRLHNDPGTFLSRALAARAFTQGPYRCNLRAGPMTHPRLTARRERERLNNGFILLASGLLLCAANLTWIAATGRKTAESERAIAATARTIVPGARIQKGVEVRTVEQELSKRSQAMEPFVAAFDRSLTHALAQVAETAGRHNLKLETLSLGRRSVKITGRAEDWNQCDKLASCLAGLGYAVKLDRREAPSDEMIHFEIATEESHGHAKD